MSQIYLIFIHFFYRVSQKYIIFILLFKGCPKYIIFILMFKWFPEHKSSTFFLLHGVPYMHNLILLLFTGCPKHLKPFIFLFTWCTEHILSNCLHGVPNICHLHSSFNMVSQTYIIFLLLLFAWYPKNNRRCYYLHSSFTGC